MMKKSYKRIVAMILAVVMVFGVPCGVYADTYTETITLTKGVTSVSQHSTMKSSTSYSNATCVAVSGATSTCHISISLVTRSGVRASNSSTYSTSNETQSIVYKSGYGIKGNYYKVSASLATSYSVSSVSLKYKITP